MSLSFWKLCKCLCVKTEFLLFCHYLRVTFAQTSLLLSFHRLQAPWIKWGKCAVSRMGQVGLTPSSPIKGLLQGPSRALLTQARAMGPLAHRDTLWACKDVCSTANRSLLFLSVLGFTLWLGFQGWRMLRHLYCFFPPVDTIFCFMCFILAIKWEYPGNCKCCETCNAYFVTYCNAHSHFDKK